VSKTGLPAPGVTTPIGIVEPLADEAAPLLLLAAVLVLAPALLVLVLVLLALLLLLLLLPHAATARATTAASTPAQSLDLILISLRIAGQLKPRLT
jgi:hypothetical protein